MDGIASAKLAPLKQWLLRTQISSRNSKTLRLIGPYLLLHRGIAILWLNRESRGYYHGLIKKGRKGGVSVKSGKFNFGEFMDFKQLIIPSIIKIVYVVFAVVVALGGLVTMFTAGIFGFFGGLIGIIVGEICLRIGCESLLVMFLIYDELKDANRKLGSGPETDAKANAEWARDSIDS
jgi:hypothetical protein